MTLNANPSHRQQIRQTSYNFVLMSCGNHVSDGELSLGQMVSTSSVYELSVSELKTIYVIFSEILDTERFETHEAQMTIIVTRGHR